MEHQTQLIKTGSPQQVDPGISEIFKLAIGTKAKLSTFSEHSEVPQVNVSMI